MVIDRFIMIFMINTSSSSLNVSPFFFVPYHITGRSLMISKLIPFWGMLGVSKLKNILQRMSHTWLTGALCLGSTAEIGVF